MGATLNPFASPKASKSIEELQVWTGLKEDFLDIVLNAVVTVLDPVAAGLDVL